MVFLLCLSHKLTVFIMPTQKNARTVKAKMLLNMENDVEFAKIAAELLAYPKAEPKNCVKPLNNGF